MKGWVGGRGVLILAVAAVTALLDHTINEPRVERHSMRGAQLFDLPNE